MSATVQQTNTTESKSLSGFLRVIAYKSESVVLHLKSLPDKLLFIRKEREEEKQDNVSAHNNAKNLVKSIKHIAYKGGLFDQLVFLHPHYIMAPPVIVMVGALVGYVAAAINATTETAKLAMLTSFVNVAIPSVLVELGVAIIVTAAYNLTKRGKEYQKYFDEKYS